jgi:hypothetical protein
MPMTESIVEDAALAWLGELGYAVLYGPDIKVGELGAERSDLGLLAAYRMVANGIEAESRCAAVPALCPKRSAP